MKMSEAQKNFEAPARSLIQKHYAAFDGLRGLAILLVFINHYALLFVPPAIASAFWPGVDLFFALSGFLITGILYEAKGSESFFKTFYIRRALRIFPLFYGFFLLVALLTRPLQLSYSRSLWSFLFYIGNLALAVGMNPTTITVDRFHHVVLALGPLWSLCVEEQFYLVWPAILFFLPTRVSMMRFCAMAVVFSMTLRTGLFFLNPARALHTHYLYFTTFTRCDTLFMGCWLALWLRGVMLTSAQVRKIALPLILVPLLILALGEAFVGRRWTFNESNPLLCTYGYTLVGLVSCGVLLLALNEQSLLHRFLKNRFLSSLGVISYGFYFFHSMPFFIVSTINGKYAHNRRYLSILLALATFGVIYLLAWLSFRFFESPFLRLKSRLAPSEPSARTRSAILAPVPE